MKAASSHRGLEGKGRCCEQSPTGPRRCRRSRRRRALGLAFLSTGLGSLLWFLVRVVPKPSRAAYPCQRAAAPFASAFVVWLLAVLGARWALARRAEFVRRARVTAAWACSAVFLVCVALGVLSIPQHAGFADPGPHGPLGIARGIHPGRVAWVHAPDATDWAGWNASEPWWQSNHTDLAVVEQMVSRGIRDVAGQESDAGAWRALFADFNSSHGRGERGYQAGERVVIKINLTTENSGSDCDLATHEKIANLNRIDNSPQMLLALLRQLVYVAGVAETNISIGDPTALFPGFLYRPLHGEFPGVTYFEVMGGAGRTETAFSPAPFYWSTPAADGKLQDYIPVPFIQADYLINFAVLKGHSSGVTSCGKNLYGSLKRCPSRFLYGQGTLDYYDMHLSLPNAEWSPGMGHYRAVVDLMGHRNLGGKTLLCLIDGLFAGYYWDSQPYPWKTPPFGDGTNADWPSSLFVSQDPVAIDSVAFDFLLNEWPAVVKSGVGATNSLQGGAEDYLHEAALAGAPPSGTFYDPEKDGERMRSLGVHEHWNNALDKQYSRNLGGTNGIELIYAKVNRMPPLLAVQRAQTNVVLSWPSSQPGYRLQAAPSLYPAAAWADVPGTPVTFQAQYVVTNEVSEGSQFYRLMK
ncbi:MAG TPA: DUF362 domain-containing protein [Verrucomicrobiae bacterium]